jgi:hypothetical protein
LRDFLKNKILNITDSKSKNDGVGNLIVKDFEDLTFHVFEYQYKYNVFYQRYCSLIGKELSKINQLSEIPFLPIQFFKNNIIKTGVWNEEFIFTSSGTTGMNTSQHFVRELDFYNQLTIQGFEYFYGSITQYCVLGLLPAYLERSGSSLVTMVDDFIKRSPYPQSGFFLYDYTKLYEVLLKNKENNIPTLLIGVSFALLDFTEKYQLDFPELIVMETGGMKGRRREITRSELHDDIKKGFNTQVIHSEYGMTELLSQGYSKGLGLYQPTSTIKMLTRDINDPLSILPNTGRLGVINIIDLGNIDTCSFIATDDLGRVYPNNTFEILGRLDNSDIRGCNLMMGDEL